jgi:hypothetical protein
MGIRSYVFFDVLFSLSIHHSRWANPQPLAFDRLKALRVSKSFRCKQRFIIPPQNMELRAAEQENIAPIQSLNEQLLCQSIFQKYSKDAP